MYDWRRLPRIWSGRNTIPMYCKKRSAEIDTGEYKRRYFNTCPEIIQKNGRIDQVIPGIRKKNWKSIIQKGFDRISKWKKIKRDYKRHPQLRDCNGYKSIRLLIVKNLIL